METPEVEDAVDDICQGLKHVTLGPRGNPAVLLVKLPGPPSQLARSSSYSLSEFISGYMSKLKQECPGLLKLSSISSTEPTKIRLSFSSWEFAATAVVGLWKLRLEGLHSFTPELAVDIEFYSRIVDGELSKIFIEHLAALECGESVSEFRLELQNLKSNLLKIKQKLSSRNSFEVWSRLSDEQSNIMKQIQMMASLLAEYINGLKSIELAIHLRNLCYTEEEQPNGEDTSLLKVGNDWTWHQLHCLMERETRRFKERLPLYSKRSDILRHIYSNQVLVLTGETGSGKSTQLVQYLVDAGFIKDGFSVVCTQPRKLAVMALAERVTEESKGCNNLQQFVGYLTSPVFQTGQPPKILYTTDYTLLQMCLRDEKLCQFGCVIVDEAHERSLNTDLLLAMLKKCIKYRPDLKVIVMSATADSALLSSYFGGCVMYKVVGRSFPVQIIYEADEEEDLESKINCSRVDHYVQLVTKKVASIHSRKEQGDILAFLTSQAEVEWACSQNFGPSALVLPLHGKLQGGEQQLVFKKTPEGMRKIVFATNVAETSLTIPDIRFVVDCGFAKESYLDSKSGMNILQVCRIDQSAAKQRAGRAGRTQAGVCYRLYSESDYEDMLLNRMPEILRVHLGVAILKLMALGVEKLEEFDFIDSPEPEAIAMAIESLHQLGAIVNEDGKTHLTSLGWQLVNLGIDPRLGYIILKCISQRLGREGLVIASLLSSSNSVFFRAGSDEEKLKSDCLKMRFCHPHGDIFTLLTVYKEWFQVPVSRRNSWCVENSINAKTMRRCQDYINEMHKCLKVELNINVASKWTWQVSGSDLENTSLRKILLSAMPKHLAVFSGHEGLGYHVVNFAKKAFLHPSSSLLVFGHSPVWVVFGELLCTTREYLTLVTVVEPEWLTDINGCNSYNVAALLSSQLHRTVFPGLSRCLLSRICGRSNTNVKSLIRKIQADSHDCCIVQPDYEKHELLIYATQPLIERANALANEAIDLERRLLNNGCIEKYIFEASPGKTSPVMLLGPGAEIRDVLMQGEYASIEISKVDSSIDDRDLLCVLDKCPGGIGSFHKDPTLGRWGTVTFCSVNDAAEAVSLLKGRKLGNSVIEVKPFIKSSISERNRPHFPSVRVTLQWPRRQARGFAKVGCKAEDKDLIIQSCSGLIVMGCPIFCRPDRVPGGTGIFVSGIGSHIFDTDLKQALQCATGLILEDVFVPRLPPTNQPSVEACREALVEEVAQFVPKAKFQAVVMGSNLDYTFRAVLEFDESEHENAAKAICYLHGRALPICNAWQRISCQENVSSSVRCSAPVYSVIKEDIMDLVKALKEQNNGVELVFTRVGNGSCTIKVHADSLRIVAGCKAALEKLIEGMVVMDGIDENGKKLLFTKDGLQMIKTVELQTRTHIHYDRRSQTIKIFGPNERKRRALSKITRNLSQLKERKKYHEIQLRGGGRPAGLMRELVKQCGADLNKLRQLVEGSYLSLDLRRHMLLVRGSRDDLCKVEKMIQEIESALSGSNNCKNIGSFDAQDCGICFCEIEDEYCLVGCGHSFCRSCIRGQIISAVSHREGFPLTCAIPGCSQKLLLVDFDVLLTVGEQDDLRKASLNSFVCQNTGRYRFCTTPDCPAVYRITERAGLFACGACNAQICTCCHVEFHLGLTCKQYEEFKLDPDLSLKLWRKDKQHVKACPSCGSVIEKVDGCNHVLCKCNAHLCWLCLESFSSSEDCYAHLQYVHGGYLMEL